MERSIDDKIKTAEHLRLIAEKLKIEIKKLCELIIQKAVCG